MAPTSAAAVLLIRFGIPRKWRGVRARGGGEARRIERGLGLAGTDRRERGICARSSVGGTDHATEKNKTKKKDEDEERIGALTWRRAAARDSLRGGGGASNVARKLLAAVWVAGETRSGPVVHWRVALHAHTTQTVPREKK